MYDIGKTCGDVIGRIKAACDERSLTYRAAALRADVSPSAMYKLMDGATVPYLDTLLKLCNALDVSVSDLLGESRGGVCDSSRPSEEDRVAAAYRRLSREKRELLKLYLAMLLQYDAGEEPPARREGYSSPGFKVNFAAIPNLNFWESPGQLMALVASGSVQKEPEWHATRMRFAGLDVRVTHRYRYLEMAGRSYLAPDGGAPDVEVTADADGIERLREMLPAGLSDDYVESLRVHELVAERMPLLDRVVFHGAVVSFRGSGYLFAAPSGTGKTTHVSLWRRHLGSEVVVVNGDKPILKVGEGVTAYGTPWAGKENWQVNTSVPLRALCLISRGDENRIRKSNPGQCLERVLEQVFLPEGAEARIRTVELVDRLLGSLEVFELECDMTPEAARCSFEALTGCSWDACGA